MCLPLGIPCCFSGDTIVQTKNGPKRLDSLQVGEKILTFSVKRKGAIPAWTKFYSFIHKEDERETEFLVLETVNSHFLKITGEHLIFKYDTKSNRNVALPASDIKICDLLIYQESEGGVRMEPVTSIKTEKLQGIYAPLTFSGTFLANGFLASCYADVQSHAAAHYALAPVRFWYRFFVQHGLSSLDLEKRGMLQYAIKLSRCRDLLFAQGKTYTNCMERADGIRT